MMERKNSIKDVHLIMNYTRGLYKILEDDWQKAAQQIGLTLAEQHALWIIYFEQKAPMSRIAEVGLWDLSTVMQIVKRLKEKGLVKTEKDENDLRISYVLLTEKGKQKHEQSKELEIRLDDFVDEYSKQSDETKHFMKQMISFLADANRHFHGEDFIHWVNRTTKALGE
ncbi:MarR family transcriptional regulator [Desertibacillus haloalkaliphilus]|uniref:MarR family transcriptional regulator n=1 Tax=Desertibacillus haloalkaliphilus TaxID=1328930 RepID=UPI001C2625DB|nr:MarR family transcriptional regulator [Desertibacillus haloalkaliphilus]MBU8907775.1 MarR family transcriptional regulator [Desertibacillus haloalkaliphilus]